MVRFPLLPDGVFLLILIPCDHGLDFLYQFIYVRIQSINQFNQSINSINQSIQSINSINQSIQSITKIFSTIELTHTVQSDTVQ